MNKKSKKLTDKKCCFCNESNYSLLDVHRIEWGKEYSNANTITVCSNCHRRIHAKEIIILGKHLCTNGCHVVQFIENNEEKFVQI
jgi:hypothetical protein